METQELTPIIEDLPTTPNELASNDFYVVGLLKFAILFSCTMGIYMAYWFYRNWKQQKMATGEDCWPIMRGIFLIFFTHELFTRIDKKLRLTEKKYDWSSQYTATLIVFFVIAVRILDKLSMKEIGSPYTDIASLLLLAIIGILLLYVQRIINFACNDPEGESNNQLTALNFLWIAIGTVIIILAVISTVLPSS
jgi:cation transport ATPase